MKTPDPNLPTVPADIYTREYFERGCGGHEEFARSHGRDLPLRLQITFELADIGPGKRVLDLGCGRGEVVLHCAERGALVWGLDYAIEGLRLARTALAPNAGEATRARLALQHANARQLPLSTGSVDVVFMVDVVEHLYPHELAEAFAEVRRVLRPGGRLVVHTSPSLWYYRFGYPLYRLVQRLRGQKLPRDPRDRWMLLREMHVNEQTPPRLRQVMRQQGFAARVWLRTTHTYDYEANDIVRWGMRVLTSVYPFRWIFCDDIFAIGTKA